MGVVCKEAGGKGASGKFRAMPGHGVQSSGRKRRRGNGAWFAHDSFIRIVRMRSVHGLFGAHTATSSWLLQVVPVPPHIRLLHRTTTGTDVPACVRVPTDDDYGQLGYKEKQRYGAHVTQPFRDATGKAALFQGRVVGLRRTKKGRLSSRCAECDGLNVRLCPHKWAVIWQDGEMSGMWVELGSTRRAAKTSSSRPAGKENMGQDTSVGRFSRFLSDKEVDQNKVCQVCQDPTEHVVATSAKKARSQPAKCLAASQRAQPDTILLCQSAAGCSGAMHLKCAPGLGCLTEVPVDKWFCSEGCRRAGKKH